MEERLTPARKKLTFIDPRASNVPLFYMPTEGGTALGGKTSVTNERKNVNEGVTIKRGEGKGYAKKKRDPKGDHFLFHSRNRVRDRDFFISGGEAGFSRTVSASRLIKGPRMGRIIILLSRMIHETFEGGWESRLFLIRSTSRSRKYYVLLPFPFFCITKRRGRRI